MAHRLALTGLLVALVAVAAARAEKGEGAPKGAPNGYRTQRQLDRRVERLAGRPIVARRSLTTTRGGRDVWLLTVWQEGGKAASKPAVLLVGSAHAPHLAGSPLTLKLAERLSADTEAARKLRRRTTFYLIPRPNPDAYAACLKPPHQARATNTRPTDEDNDGTDDEDGPSDLNGDGWITAMRVRHPAGQYARHPDEPRLLVKADPSKDEAGRYKLLREGRDEDGDGAINEDPPGGVNFNRNFTFDYPYFEPGAGPHQVSEPETRAVADFAFEHPNIAAVFTFGPDDNLHPPWDAKPAGKQEGPIKKHLLAADAPHYKRLAERYRKLREMDGAPKPGDGKGSFAKWAYFHFGRWSFAARAWWPPRAEEGEGAENDQKDEPDARGKRDRRALRWFERSGIDGFAAWEQVEPPDFPGRIVEVGGIRRLRASNPPIGKVSALVEPHFQFLQALSGALPRVSIEQVQVKRPGGDVVRITATIENRGALPTMPKMGEITAQPHPLQAAIELPEGATLLTGHRRMRLGPIEAGGSVEQTWLLRTDAKSLKLRVFSPSVRGASRKVQLR